MCQFGGLSLRLFRQHIEIFMRILVACFVLMLTCLSDLSAKEGYMCQNYFDNVDRKYNSLGNIQELSVLAKEKIFDDLKFDLKECIANCEGVKFKYCNDVAKELEGGKPAKQVVRQESRSDMDCLVDSDCQQGSVCRSKKGGGSECR